MRTFGLLLIDISDIMQVQSLRSCQKVSFFYENVLAAAQYAYNEQMWRGMLSRDDR